MGVAHSRPESIPVQTIRVVASCTQGKTRSVPEDLRLGSISSGPLSERLVAWRGRLQKTREESIAAVQLYRGQHWVVVRELPAAAQQAGYHADLWVASAGYGLLPAEAPLRPYSATFSASDKDSVWRPGDGDRREVLRNWWNGLQTLAGWAAGTPRSLTALAAAAPDAIVLVIASPVYVTAIADGLRNG